MVSPKHESGLGHQRDHLRPEFPRQRAIGVGSGPAGTVRVNLSLFILEEVAGVLVRKFGWDEERSARAIRTLEHAATVIEPPQLAEVIEGGHADNRVLECAISASADYLITGDRRHLLPIGEHRGARIVNAPRFLSELGA